MRNYLPLEEHARNETEKLYAQWNKGCYKFLLQRTSDYFDRQATSQRRGKVEHALGLSLPALTDQMLSYLYDYTARDFRRFCARSYEHTGFQMTTTEKKFASSVAMAIQEIRGGTNLEIYPSLIPSTEISRMLIGVHVPDFIFFGLKQKGFAAIAIEIDGDAHVYKAQKDFQKYRNLEALGILTLSIPNEKVQDLDFIRNLLKGLKQKRTTAFRHQLASTKRKIWCKTIACHLSLSDVEALIKSKFDVDLGLLAEAAILKEFECCPRDIQKELRCL